MHRQLCTLALAALLIAAPGLALAHGEGPQQTVDGYIVTLMPPEKGFFTGSNPVAVSLWDWQGNTPEAAVSVQLLAFAPPGDGHGDSHGEAAPADDHAASDAGDGHGDSHGEAAPADDHAASDTGHAADNDTDHAASDTGHAADTDHATTGSDHAASDTGHDAASDTDHAASEAEHGHDAASATEGQGLVVAPVALAAGEELGEYRGEVAFDEVGTYTLSVVFTIDGEERGALFDVAVAQSRPRGLVLGGFALVNGLAIGAAYLIKRRAPARAAKPARPAAATPTTTEE